MYSWNLFKYKNKAHNYEITLVQLYSIWGILTWHPQLFAEEITIGALITNFITR
jgi:hypothetical protein